MLNCSYVHFAGIQPMSTRMGEVIGYSELSINDAIRNALQQVIEQPTYFKVIETQGSQYVDENKCYYQVILSLFFD